MTNEEAIKILESMRVFRNGSNANVEAIDIAINSIQENTKLKAEIEQLKKQRETRIKVSEANFNIYSKLEIERDNLVAEIEQLKEDSKIIAKELVTQIREIDKLKSELKQSVKEKSEVISKIEYALSECEPIYNKCAVIPQAKSIYDLAMNYCLDLLKGQV